MSVHLDRGYNSKAIRERLEEERGLLAEISEKGKPAARWRLRGGG